MTHWACEQDWLDEATWQERLRRDAERAAINQTVGERRASRAVVECALACGAESIALTGSVARGRRTRASDLDLHIIGTRPQFDFLGVEVDVYATSTEIFWRGLCAGDDYIQWTLRYGCILHDSGTFRDALSWLAASRVMPTPERKLRQAQRMLPLVSRIVASGDLDAAQESVRAVLTTTARWLLLAERLFPLSRDELAGQLHSLGYIDLSAALHRSIHDEPQLDELAQAVRLASTVVAMVSADHTEAGTASARHAREVDVRSG